ncbi:MAG TPA: hypothetical protein VNO26_13915 [Candidatus Limnocylindria bacterium]|nr:hypothetical protein [Candidatus Limnocylindria bacterium]
MRLAKVTAMRAWSGTMAAAMLLLGETTTEAAPIRMNGVGYQAIMVAPNYPGGPAFDNNLALSRAELAAAFATWPNWRRGLGGNIVELPGNTNRTRFLNAFTPFIAGGAEALQAGDLFVVLYFGHGSKYDYRFLPFPFADFERLPAFDTHDEVLFFPDHSAVTDDDLRAKFAQFAPGVFKLFINVSCFSGGAWNGNDASGAGDLELVPRSIMMSSSREHQFTFTAGIPPRRWEPLFLARLINVARFADHTVGLSIAQYYALSAAFGSAVNASRFDDPEPVENPPPGDALWAVPASGDFESTMEANVPDEEMPDLAASGPCTSTPASTTTTTTCPPWSFLVRTSGKIGNGGTVDGGIGANDRGGLFRLGKDVLVTDGHAVAGDHVRLGSGSSVPDVQANVLWQGPGAIVHGTHTPAILPLAAPFCPIPSFTCGTSDVLVPTGGSSGPLAPGSYGRLIIGNGGTLTLAPGTFTFCSVRTGRAARIETTGGVQSTINVVGTLRLLNGSFLGPDAGTQVPDLVVAGDLVRLSQSSDLQAFLSAPNALLKVGRMAHVTGGFCVGRSSSDKLTTLTCLAAACGNGIVEPGEACDPPDVHDQCAATEMCDATCQLQTLPGDGDRFGAATTACDFNGDGFADLAVGVPLEDIGTVVDAGAVNVLYGGPPRLSDAGNQFWSEDSPLVGGTAQAGDRYGSALAADDFNSDGFCDLAIGIPGRDSDAGATRILYGRPSGLAAAGSQLWDQTDPMVDDLAEAGDRFGSALAAGDFDRDGFVDLAIGVPGEDVGTAVDAGAVNVLYGSAGGLSSIVSQFWTRDDPDVADSSATGYRFGSAVTAGDFNGDGFADLAIGIPGADVGGSTDAGAVTVLYGAAVRLSGSGSQRFDQGTEDVEDCPEAGDLFGSALATGDFNGDGFADLAIGVPGEDAASIVEAGAVNVLYGRVSGLSATNSQLWDQDILGVGDVSEEKDHFGSALTAGDFNGDGFADLASGVPDESVGVNVEAGAVNVLYGAAPGLGAAGNQVWHQDQPAIEDMAEEGDHFGCALAHGDFNGDGFADLAIGVPGEDIGAIVDAGAVNVLYGTAARLSSLGDQFWHQDALGVADDAE